MNSLKGIVFIALALILSFASANAQANQDLSSFSIFATNSSYFKAGTIVRTGDIGVVDQSPGPWLDSESEVTIGVGVYLHDDVSIYGDTVKIKIRASVNDVYYNELNNNGTVRGVENQPLVLPLDVSLPVFPTPNPGTDEVDIGWGQTLTLGPGSYGDVHVMANATLVLTGGVYHFENLDLGLCHAKVLCQGPTDLIINNRLLPGPAAVIGPDDGSGIDASDIRIYVNGVNGGAGGPNAYVKAARIGFNNDVKANIYAPNGTILVRAGSLVEGALIGKDVIIGYNVEVTRKSALGDTPYTISGNAGMDGVTMSGLPGDPVTSGGGFYSATVDYGWSGTVTPTMTGYTFDPVNRVYSNVSADQADQDFAPTLNTYTLTMAVAGNGSTAPAVGTHTYDAGTVVDISTIADACWQFDTWTGDVADPNASSTTVTMDGDKTVTANFAEIPQVTHVLTMAVTGNGSTTPSVGVHTYDADTIVDISAIADSCWQFVNWTGDVADPNASSTTVTMDSDKTVTANFSQISYTLTMAVAGNGSTTPAVGAHAYACGTIVDISAIADPCWQFDNWTGDVADPNAANTTVTMDGDKTVTANFSQISYTLTMAVAGNGSTTPAVGAHAYACGTIVDISAIADPCWQFDNWTGDVADPNAAN
ncbi:MAG: hypothetical protein SWQ30_23075, partial [Thermodesulfobacteriota bacterium]|nr:hypothetical protein [Thermodesulfobacteriota bacterium]